VSDRTPSEQAAFKRACAEAVRVLTPAAEANIRAGFAAQYQAEWAEALAERDRERAVAVEAIEAKLLALTGRRDKLDAQRGRLDARIGAVEAELAAAKA
jgi:hypothetical protein